VTLSVTDQLAILDVVHRADEAASLRDADAYVALFTPDAVLDGAQGSYSGREALRAAVGMVWNGEGPATLHLTLNPVIEADEHEGNAVVRSVLLIVSPGPPPEIRTTALIRQELRRDGTSWRIALRTVTATGGVRES
jgi:ketosteroid isomerase-like protein